MLDVDAGVRGVGLLFSWRVDINEFSIHHFYKNRLVRCYLGASHTTAGKPTGSPASIRTMTCRSGGSITPSTRRGRPMPGPYPIVNCALNLVGGQDLAWQERKATSFVFTPKYCGYDVDRAVLTKGSSRQRSEGYVPTTAFYRDNEGPLLGMAMAISGAAANPNMGRASSPALALSDDGVQRAPRLVDRQSAARARALRCPGPRFGLTYTALELFGATDDDRKYVNLSDGGHFDNLGVYELIRRSCRYIIVCDAGQDARFVCEDLGDLVRRCRTDFGVEIDIAVDRIRQRDSAGISQTHCVVGQIHYLNIPKRDDQRTDWSTEDGGPVVPGCRPGSREGLSGLHQAVDDRRRAAGRARILPAHPRVPAPEHRRSVVRREPVRELSQAGMHVAEAHVLAVSARRHAGRRGA